MRTTTGTIGSAALVLLTLTGCSLGRASQPLEQYVLGGTSVTQQGASSNTTSPNATSSDAASSNATSSNATSSSATSSQVAAGLTIGLRRLDLAPYLASPAIVVRRGTHQIVTSEYHRWGEDPGAGINRAVARYLIAPGVAAGMTIRAVDIAPWPLRARHDFLVQLHIARFEGTASGDSSATIGEAHVQATWEIIRQFDGVVLARGLTDHRQPGWRVGDYAGLVTLLDGGLISLSREIAGCMARLGASVATGAADVGGAGRAAGAANGAMAAAANGATAGGATSAGAAAGGAIQAARELSCGTASRL